MSDDLVWIRGSAEVNVAGVDPVVIYESVPRDEWDAMSSDAREAYIDDVAGSALEQMASYGGSVVDESEVPEGQR